jgi:hypothetical protein
MKKVKKISKTEAKRKLKLKSNSNAQEYLRRKIKKINAEYIELFTMVQTELKGNLKKKIEPNNKFSRSFKTILNEKLNAITKINKDLRELQGKRAKIQPKYKPKRAAKQVSYEEAEEGGEEGNLAINTYRGWEFNDFLNDIKGNTFDGFKVKSINGISLLLNAVESLLKASDIFKDLTSNEVATAYLTLTLSLIHI